MNTGRIVALLLTTFVLALPVSAGPIEFQDVAGRTVKLAAPAQRIVLSDGRYVEALSIVEAGNPARRVVGMAGGPQGSDPAILSQLYAKWPQTKDIPVFGGRGPESVSVETLISLKPDIAIFGLLDHGADAKNAEIVAQLQKAGIAVAFIDFRLDPLNNTAPSIAIIGEVLGAPDKAKAFTDFYTSHKQRIAERVAKAKDLQKPKVFLQAHVGRMPCCVGMANGMLGPMIGFVGGRNLSAEASPGPVGRHTPEFLIAGEVDVLIGTASGGLADFEAEKPMIVLGGDVDAKTAQASLERAFKAVPGAEALPAWSAGRVHGIWHHLYNSPFNLYALENFAKWVHPELFADLDPEATLSTLYRDFTPFEPSGTYAVTLAKP
jgi:iron complex transport system substrate-binding protein